MGEMALDGAEGTAKIFIFRFYWSYLGTWLSAAQYYLDNYNTYKDIV